MKDRDFQLIDGRNKGFRRFIAPNALKGNSKNRMTLFIKEVRVKDFIDFRRQQNTLGINKAPLSSFTHCSKQSDTDIISYLIFY